MLNVATARRRPASPTRHESRDRDPKGMGKVWLLVVDGQIRGGYLSKFRARADAERWRPDVGMEDGQYTRALKVESIDVWTPSLHAVDEPHLKGKPTAMAGEGNESRRA
jgi:hypothetical protein